MTSEFKKCPLCSFKWDTMEAFLGDPDIQIIGYQVHFEELSLGIFLFNHSCKGTLAIPVKMLQPLYTGPIFAERLTGQDVCPSYCLHERELEPCRTQCECAYVREIIDIIKKWPKH